jgi:hypothetical protein
VELAVRVAVVTALEVVVGQVVLPTQVLAVVAGMVAVVLHQAALA